MLTGRRERAVRLEPSHPAQAMKRAQDHYARRAKQDGFAARSAYKLEEIDRRKGLLKAGQRVLDLGCAPGSWLQYAAARVGENGMVIGIDVQPVAVALPPQARALEGDVFGPVTDMLPHGGRGFDVILSDMAPKTTGVPSGDAARSAALARRALELARALLRPGGVLLVKVFQGGEYPALRQEFRACFQRVTVEKPKASRSESVEVFLLGTGFQPAASSQAARRDGEAGAGK